MFNGMRVFLDENLVDWQEDWSAVRSPSRARRRRARGFRQRIIRTATPKKVAFQFEGSLFMHPAMWGQLKDKVART